MSISPDSTLRKKIGPSELIDVEFKIGQVTFYSRWTKILPSGIILFWMNKTFTIRTNFFPDEQKFLPSELKDVEFKIGQIAF